MTNSTALVQYQTDAVPVDQVQALVAGKQDIQEFAAILKKILPGGDKLSDQEVLAGAVYAKMTGQIPGRDFYIAPNFGVIPGYQGEQKQAVNGAPLYLPPEYRMMTDDERDFHDIAPGDKSAICEIWVPARMREMRDLGVEPRPIVGIGIVRKAEQWVSFEWTSASSGKRYKRTLPESEWKERADAPTGRSWGWVARNRAYKDALRHLPGHQDTDDILIEGAQRGLVIEVPEGAQLSADQARLMIAQAERDANRPELTYEQHQERLQANVNRMRGPERNAFDEADGEYRVEALTAEQPAQPATNEPAPFEPEPGEDVWADWKRPEHAQAWAMAQGKFDHQRHMQNGYAKVKADCNPTNAREMWRCWYEYVMAHEPAKTQPTDNDYEGNGYDSDEPLFNTD